MAAWASAQMIPSITIQWKAGDGSWSRFTAAAINAIAKAVSAHVQACFACEQRLEIAITGMPPTVTSFEPIDAAFAALAP